MLGVQREGRRGWGLGQHVGLWLTSLAAACFNLGELRSLSLSLSLGCRLCKVFKKNSAWLNFGSGNYILLSLFLWTDLRISRRSSSRWKCGKGMGLLCSQDVIMLGGDFLSSRRLIRRRKRSLRIWNDFFSLHAILDGVLFMVVSGVGKTPLQWKRFLYC